MFTSNAAVILSVCMYVSPSAVGEGGEEEGEDALQYLLATDSGQLQVFQDSSLKWAAALPHPPTDISVATFQSVPSFVCPPPIATYVVIV